MGAHAPRGGDITGPTCQGLFLGPALSELKSNAQAKGGVSYRNLNVGGSELTWELTAASAEITVARRREREESALPLCEGRTHSW